jgi:O-antigen/teichoic acid export membrane protein
MMACVILAVGAAKIFDSLSDICYGFFQVNERMDMVAASLIIKSLVGLISFAALYVFTDSLAAASTGWALIWGAIFLLHDIGRVKRLRLALIGSDSLKTTNTEKVGIWPTWDQRILVKLGLLALPLGLSLGFDSLALNIPRYFLSYYRSEADLGIFMSLQYIVMSFSIIAMPLGQAALPRLAKYISAGDYSSYIRMISVFLIVGLISGLIITFLSVNFGSEILIFVYSKAYANNHIAFIWLTVGGATNIIFLFLAFGLLASRDFRLMALPYFAGPVAATALSAITIQDMGILGASITYAGVNLFVCLFMAICLVYKTCEGLK